MERHDALQEFNKMWIWLCKHPAHDSKYYVNFVAKPQPTWKNDCPLCALSEGECKECGSLWNEGRGSLCTDPESPLSKWRTTERENPDYRTWYAGKIVDIVGKSLR